MTIDEIQQSIIEEFSVYTDYLDKYQALMNIARKCQTIDKSLKTEKNLVNGCQNNVWMTYHIENDMLIYEFDSDSSIAKGIIALIMRAVNNHTPQEIANTELYFIEEIGLKDQLSNTRGNGMRIILDKIAEIANSLV